MAQNTTEIHSEKDCDFCDSKAGYDGKTKLGAWAYMCKTHFNSLGIGLGTGKGQKLELVA